MPPRHPTVLRLSFRIAPSDLEAWAAVYQQDVVLLLDRHRFPPSTSEKAVARPSAEGVFSRYFAFADAAAALERRRDLEDDPDWPALTRRLSQRFGGSDDRPFYRLSPCRTPAGPGRKQETGPGLHRGRWHTFNGQDGLPSTTIRAIVQDRRGDLWFGTDGGGVCRFDGSSFVSFSSEDGLADHTVLAIAEDGGGRLWFGTRHGGISRYENGEFVNFTSEDGFGGDMVGCIVTDRRDHVWFATYAGIYRFDGRDFHRIVPLQGRRDMLAGAIFKDGAGNIWYADEDAWVRHDGESPVRLPQDQVHSGTAWAFMGEDGAGELWLQRWGGSDNLHRVFRLDGQRAHPVESLDDKSVECMLVDRSGRLWFGTSTQGLWCRADEGWKGFTTREGLANDQILCAAEDRQGSLWFGTLGGGVSRYDTSLQAFTVEDGLSSNGVMSILQDGEGDLWFGTWEGVCRFDGKRFTPFEPLAGRNVWCAHQDRRGRLWFGAMDLKATCCAASYDGHTFRAWGGAAGLRDFQVTCIAEDADGRLFFGTAQGVDAYDSGRFSPLGAEGQSLAYVKALLTDRRGHLWSGHALGAEKICRFDGHRWETVAQGHDRVGLGVWCIAEDRRGRVWFGTLGQGVYCSDRGRLQRYSTADGLAHDTVHAILEDDKGVLWFGTFGGGVCRFDGRVFQTLSQRDGLPHDTVQSLVQDRRGDVWIGTEGGVARYRRQEEAPKVRLTDVVADRHYGAPERVLLPASQELVAFEFLGSSFSTRPDRMAYVYRLLGHHEDWRPVYRRRVEYQGLPAAAYTFQVQAVDRDLNYSEIASIELVVEPDAFREGVAGVLSGDREEIVGDGPAILRVQSQLRQVADTDWTVLVHGETGTGKGMAARYLHRASPRRDQPLIPVNCGAIPEGLVESELFGHEKGAFTGAVSRQLGKVELATGGTLFLDEIGDLPLAAQVKLLRFLEDRAFQRVGGQETLQADARIVAATNRDLEEAVAAKTFRQDLYFRLEVFSVELPPLRRRPEDIPLLATHFARRFARHLNRPVPEILPGAVDFLQEYDWPGNVRELEHLIQRAVLVCGGAVAVEDLALGRQTGVAPAEGPFVSLEEYDRRNVEREREYLRRALQATDGVIYGERGAARLLGVHPEKLRSRMKRLGVRYRRSRPQS